MTAKLAILVGPKGRGSNMWNLIRACRNGVLDAEVHCVICPSADSPAFQSLAGTGVSHMMVPYQPAETYSRRLMEAFRGADFICLAGFMKLLPSEVLRAFPNRVLNIHPALLPKFGGKGMYGHHVHEAVLAAGEKESGCTVHLVTDQYDEGEILVQLCCPVRATDTPESLAARVLELEHRAYPEAVRLLMERL